MASKELTISDTIFKAFGKEVKSLGRSLFQSTAKKTIKDLLFKPKVKSKEQIKQEIVGAIGYETQHYQLTKDQRINFKAGSVFLNEWLNNNHSVANKILRDEETGSFYFNGEPLTNAKKLELINQFTKQTGIKSTALTSHLDQALKLFDPIDFTAIKFKEHFKGWKASDPSIIDIWMERCFGDGLATDKQYASNLFRKWIVGAAKRITSPGSSLDGCLTFTGPAGGGKTQFFRQLLPPPFENRTGELLCSIKNQVKFVEGMLGKSVCCFDELSVLAAPKVQEVFKTLLTSQFVDVRLPYRKDATRYNLRSAFSATTNETKFIKDPALSRRLWVISLNGKTRLDFDFLRANRDLLWKEALFWAENGEQSYLSIEEQERVEEENKKHLL